MPALLWQVDAGVRRHFPIYFVVMSRSGVQNPTHFLMVRITKIDVFTFSALTTLESILKVLSV